MTVVVDRTLRPKRRRVHLATHKPELTLAQWALALTAYDRAYDCARHVARKMNRPDLEPEFETIAVDHLMRAAETHDPAKSNFGSWSYRYLTLATRKMYRRCYMVPTLMSLDTPVGEDELTLAAIIPAREPEASAWA